LTIRRYEFTKEFEMKKKLSLILLFVFLFAIRFYGLNWDQGYHLHPDERMIVMVAERISLPESWQEFFSPQSPANPRFFAYGSLPIYLLKLVSVIISFIGGAKWLTYAHLPYLGRGLSILFDLGSVWLVYQLGKTWNRKTAFLAAFLYGTAVLPVQLSHFYAVDIGLNFFILLTLFRLLIFYDRPGVKNGLLVGGSFGLALATKISAGLLVVPIGAALAVDLGLLFFKQLKEKKVGWWGKFRWFLQKSFRRSFLIRLAKKELFFLGLVIAAAGAVFVICQPYAVIDFANFWRQITAQQQMTSNAYVFPYTLQYVGTLSYWYFVKNMILWGAGIGLGLIFVLGGGWYIIDLGKRLIVKGNYDQEAKELVMVSFALVYFLFIGRFAVKFMRYFLPLYPIFALMGSRFMLAAGKKLPKFRKVLFGLFLFIHLGWLTSFLLIYSRPHSRVQASLWMRENIPPKSVIAVEHWDDRLPLKGGDFRFVEMPMYESDNSKLKWEKVANNLKKADYLVLASNRLYTPLLKLADCDKHKVCYPKTAVYYQDLFAGKLGFEKVAEFSSYPGLKISERRFEINDQSADESFTVYDHPLVTIFKKK